MTKNRYYSPIFIIFSKLSYKFFNACFINELGSSKSETVINTVETLKVIFKPKESGGN